MAGRTQRPLFDLIDAPLDKRPRSPVATVSHAPTWAERFARKNHSTPAPAPSAPAPRAERKQPDSDEASSAPAAGWAQSVMGERSMRVPVNALLYALVALLVLCVGVWWAGVSWGQKRKERELQVFTRDTSVPVREPPSAAVRPNDPASTKSGAGGAPLATNTGAARQPTGGTRVAESPKPTQQPTTPTIVQTSAPTQTPIQAHASSQADPRQVGWNYLHLADLSKAETDSAIEYLRAGGVEAFAAPLDSGPSRANNGGPGEGTYRLFALPGFPGGKEFGKFTQQQTELRRKVLDLGFRWQREKKGSSNFSMPLWTKYAP